jgi:hypothetical protein
MRAAILFLAFLPAAALAAADKPAEKPACVKKGPTTVSNAPAGMKRLDQLPAANEYLTVLRTEDGCTKPVIVRYGVDRKTPQR